MINLRLGRISWLLAPGYSHCLRCKTSWLFVKGHTTVYCKGRGCFPLCQKCWAQLTPDQRLPYYGELIWSWSYPYNGHTFDEIWHEVKKVVLAGL